MSRKAPPTQQQIQEMQVFYNLGNSLQKVASKFGWQKKTLIKYIETRKPKHLSEEQFKMRRSQAVMDERRRKKQRLVEYKGGKCIHCDYNRCLSSMDFHHRDPATKEFGINECMSRSIELLMKEADKCDLICRNCHGEVNEGLIQQSYELSVSLQPNRKCQSTRDGSHRPISTQTS